MTHTTKIDPVAKTLEINVGPDSAFELFVNRMGDWWPLSSHSVGGDDATDVRITTEVGGTIREVTSAGIEHTWGTITTYDQGSRIQFTWHPGAPEAEATNVDVRFDKTKDGTRVTLIHSGWEVRGEDAQRIRDNYESGWDVVLAPYAGSTG
jgi:hypothetical protein